MHESITEAPKAAAPVAAPRKPAAFYDLDGTLVKGNVVAHWLFYALNEGSFSAQASRLLTVAAKAPRLLALERKDRRAMNEAFYKLYAGISEDRLRCLSRDLFDAVVKPAIFPGARGLVEADLDAGHTTVLVTGALDVVAEPLARHLGIQHVAANRLAFDAQGYATGDLMPPILAGPEKAIYVRRFAEQHGIDLERSRAYSDDWADLPFLSSVGRPVATNPDEKLRATAQAHGWPTINLARLAEGPHSKPPKGGVLDRAFDGALTVLRLLEKKR